MTKENIARLVRVSRIYNRRGWKSLARLINDQLDKERKRLISAGLEDVVTAAREADKAST